MSAIILWFLLLLVMALLIVVLLITGLLVKHLRQDIQILALTEVLKPIPDRTALPLAAAAASDLARPAPVEVLVPAKTTSQP